MSSFLPPKFRALDANGVPLPGAKLYFYEADSSTPLSTYSDEALDNANANPLTADADGYFGRIYLQPDQEYKVTLKTSADVTIWEEDNIDAVQLAGDRGLSLRLAQVATTPLDFGAEGDGETDDYAAVQAAIDAASYTVDLLGLTYRVDSGLVLRSSIRIINGGLDFSQAVNSPAACLTLEGTLGSTVDLSSNGSAGDTSIDVDSVSGIVQDDVVLIRSGSLWSDGSSIGELGIVNATDSGPLIELATPLEADYTTASNSFYQKANVLGDVLLENLEIISNASASVFEQVLLDLICVRNVTVRNVKFVGVKDYAVRANIAADVLIENCDIRSTQLLGVGVQHEYACRNIVIANTRFANLETGISFSDNGFAQARYTTVRGCSFQGCNESIYASANADRLVVECCSFGANAGTGGIVGLKLSCARATVTNCSFTNYEAGDCINGDPLDTAIVYAGTGLKQAILVQACHLSRVGFTRTTPVTFRGCSFYGPVSVGGSVIVEGCSLSPDSSSTGGLVASGNLTVANCQFTGISGHSIDVGSGHCVLVGNYIAGTQTSGLGVVNINGASSARVVGNTVLATGGEALVFDESTASANLSIANNLFHALSNGERAATFGNAVSGPQFVSITGNIFRRNNDGDRCVYLDHVSDCVLTGNIFHNGTYGIVTNSPSSIMHDGNRFSSMATGNTNGTITAGDAI